MRDVGGISWRSFSVLWILGAILFSRGPLLSAGITPPILLDMGTSESPVEEGYERVTAKDRYDSGKGYGFVESTPKGFVLQAPQKDLMFQMSFREHFENHGTPLLIDGVRSRDDIRFRVDVPNGRYRLTVSLGDLLKPTGSIALHANGERIENNIAIRHGLYRGIRDAGDPRRPSVTGFYDRVRFTVDVDEGAVVIRLAGDENEYRRLMRIEETKEQPAIFMGTRKLRNQKPPYEDIGEPFRDIPLLGIEIRPYVEPPVTMPEHGKLKYAGRSEAVAKAVDAFNAGQYAEAGKSLKDTAGDDPLGGALVALWLMGWPPREDEAELLSQAKDLLDRALVEDPTHTVALEARENLDAFGRALSRHLGRSGTGKNHFIENVRGYHLFRLAQPGDPLYWKSIQYAGRIAYMLDPNRWTATAGTGKRLMKEILEAFPDNRFAKYYVRGEFDSNDGPWAMKNYSAMYRGAPVWAAKLHESYNRILDVSEWWVENKQKPDGSLGGGWGDDVEIVGLFGYYGAISEGASPPAVKGARRLVDGMYKYSGDIEPESGYIWHAADTEHSAEWTGDTLPMMFLIDYGNPLWIERGLKTARLMRDLWTGKNAKGHRLFRANFTGGLGVGGGLRANDSAINMRATFPAERVLWYNRHPEIEGLFVELADAWLAAAMSTDKDKPRGFIPPNVAFDDGELGGRNAPAWYQGNHAPGTVNYDFGAYKGYHLNLFVLAYELTGDRKYLEPIRLEAEAFERMSEVKADQNAEVGSAPHIKHGLAPSAAVWRRFQEGSGGPDTQGGRPLRPSGIQQDVIDKCSEVIRQLRARWPVMTTEASATDRVAFPGIVHPYLIYSGGSVGRGIESLTASVTYTGIGRDFAAYLTKSTPQEMEVRLYAFRDGKVKIGLRPWALEIGGTYEVGVATDRDGDGKPDGPGVVSRFVLEQRGESCPVAVDGRTPSIVSFRQTAKGRGQQPRPDLSLWEGDLEYHDEKGYLTVRVHNTGTAEASDIQVVVYEGAVEDGRIVGRGIVSHLAWPRDLLSQTIRLGWRYRPRSERASFTAVIDPDNEIEEICEANNRASRAMEFDPEQTGPDREATQSPQGRRTTRTRGRAR